MTTKLTSSADTQTLTIPGETFLLSAVDSIVVTTGANAVEAPEGFGGRTLRIDGIVESLGVGILFDNGDGNPRDKIVIATSGRVTGDNRGISVDNGIVEIVNRGVIFSDLTALNADCDRNVIRNFGVIEGTDAGFIVRSQLGTSVVNDGAIKSGNNSAIDIEGNFRLENSGLIAMTNNASPAIFVRNADAPVTIDNSGTITSGGGVWAILVFLANDGVRLDNSGLIEGRLDLAATNGGANVIDNRGGRIVGDIVSGSGDDTFILAGNSLLTGTVFGGDGDDTYVVDVANVGILENADSGTDTIRTSVDLSLGIYAEIENLVLLGRKNLAGFGNAENNVMRGNGGDNTLKGLEGEDELAGGKGRDTLEGGDDDDVFVFRRGDGRDVVDDFSSEAGNQDVVDLSGVKAITSFKDLIRDHLDFKGKFAIIDAGGGDELRLRLETGRELEAADFQF